MARPQGRQNLNVSCLTPSQCLAVSMSPQVSCLRSLVSPTLPPQQQRAAHIVRRPRHQLSLRAKALPETLVLSWRSREFHNNLVELLGLALRRRDGRNGQRVRRRCERIGRVPD